MTKGQIWKGLIFAGIAMSATTLALTMASFQSGSFVSMATSAIWAAVPAVASMRLANHMKTDAGLLAGAKPADAFLDVAWPIATTAIVLTLVSLMLAWPMAEMMANIERETGQSWTRQILVIMVATGMLLHHVDEAIG